MANEITHASMESDLRMASVLMQEMRIQLADNADLRSLALNLGSVNGTLSDTHAVRYAGLDAADFAAASSEISDEAHTALTDASASIAVVRYHLGRQISDLAALTGNAGDATDPAVLAAHFVRAYNRLHASLLCDAGDAATTAVGGGAGIDFSVDNLYSGIYALQLNAVPNDMIAAVLAEHSFNEFQASLRSEGGANAFQPSGAVEMLRAKGPGLAGMFLGVEIWKSSYVNVTGGTARNFIFDRGGAFGYKWGNPVAMPGVVIANAENGLAVEFERLGTYAMTEAIGHAYLGYALLEAARCVEITTDDV